MPDSLRLPLRDPSKSSVAARLHPTRHTLAKQAVPNNGLCAYTCILKGLNVAHSKLPEAALALRLYYLDLLAYVFTHPDYLLIDGTPVTDLLEEMQTEAKQVQYLHDLSVSARSRRLLRMW